MEKKKSLIDKIKKIVMADIELAELMTADGAKLFAESFVPGEAVFSVDEEGEKLPLPVGEYPLEDGSILVVSEEGVIADLMAKVEESTLSDEELEAIGNKLKSLSTENEKLKAQLEKDEAQMKLNKAKRKGVKASPEGKVVELDKRIIMPQDRRSMSVRDRIHSAMERTAFYKQKFNLDTTTSVTSTFAGEFAGDYIAAATLQGVTLGAKAITVKENIKYKQVVKKVATTDILADQSCDFTPTGTVTLTERIIEPKPLQVNLQLCKDDFQADWDAISMGYSAFDVLPPTFQAFFAEQLALGSNEAVELNLWHGDASNAGEFGGFVTKMTADTDIIDVVGTTVTAANVVEELGKVADAVPVSIYNTEDLTIYISPNVARAYIRALGGFGAAGLGGSGYEGQGNVGTKPLNFDGIPLFVANGLTANYMVAGQARNLWYGTGLMNDKNEVKILDMADIDGSMNVRFIMRFTGDAQYGIGAECVLYTPA